VVIEGFLIFFGVLVLFSLVFLYKATYLVQQAQVVVIERLGNFHEVLRPGLHFIIPFMDQPRKVLWTFVKENVSGKAAFRFSEFVERIDLREAVYDFPKQSVITKDNVTMEINALLYYQVTDPRAALYEVANLPQAIEKLTQTTLRNIIGSMELDETLTSRDKINEKLRHVLDDATDKWGVKVNRVELQEVNPPQDIKVSMEKQMKAERDRRALILEAEGLKTASVLKAEGEYLSKMQRAKAEAESKRLIAQADADSITVVREAVPSSDPLPYMIAINYLKVLPEIMKDKDGKVILMPYESSALLGSLSSIGELFKKTGGN
jgi:regulator of protease activity HflC (stomatin/prohibitin superfamily)